MKCEIIALPARILIWQHSIQKKPAHSSFNKRDKIYKKQILQPNQYQTYAVDHDDSQDVPDIVSDPDHGDDHSDGNNDDHDDNHDDENDNKHNDSKIRTIEDNQEVTGIEEEN